MRDMLQVAAGLACQDLLQAGFVGLVGLDPTVMLVAKSELAFRSHARRLNEPAFNEVSGLTNGCRERLVGRVADFATSISVVGVDGPWRHRVCQSEIGVDLKQRRPSVDQIRARPEINALIRSKISKPYQNVKVIEFDHLSPDRPLAELEWTRRSMFSSFTG